MSFTKAQRPTNYASLKHLLTATALAGLSFLTSISLSAAGSYAAAPQSRYYAATGHTVSGAFLGFFDTYGGVKLFGYPISDTISEGGRPVQYFERQRLEYHQEAAGTQFEVQLSRLGAQLVPKAALQFSIAPFASTQGKMYFPESKHSLGSPFIDYWRANGGLRIFGFPLSEPVRENGLYVQYFERARMEYHPEKAGSGYGVELGLLGKAYLNSQPDIASRISVTSDRAVASTSRGTQPQAQAQPAAPANNFAPLNARENQMLALINQARQAAGVRPVALLGGLRTIALSRSQDMVARSYFSHTTPDGKSFLDMIKGAGLAYKYAGEILTNNNYPGDVASSEGFNSFMNSQHHKDILLDPRYTVAGVGEAVDSKGFFYYTVLFLQQ